MLASSMLPGRLALRLSGIRGLGRPPGFRGFVSRPKIGVLRLDYDWQKLKGDIDDKSTYQSMGFDMTWAKVEGFSFVNAQQGMEGDQFRDSFLTHEECAAYDALDPAFKRDPSKSVQTAEGRQYTGASIQASMLEAIRKLEDEGVSYITGNCGFMMNFQSFVTASTAKPVMMSSLMQLPILARSMKNNQVVVLTANSESFDKAWDSLVPAFWNIPKEQIIVIGCEDIPGFGDEVAAGLAHNPTKAAPAMCNVVMRKIKEHGNRAKAVLMECTELPHYVQAVRNVTQLPVYDVVTMIQIAEKGLAGGKFMRELENVTDAEISTRPEDQILWSDATRTKPVRKPKIGVLRLDRHVQYSDTLPFFDNDVVRQQMNQSDCSLGFEYVYKRLEGVTLKDCINGLSDGLVTWPSEMPQDLVEAAKTNPSIATLLEFAADLEKKKYEDTIYLPMSPWDWPVQKACSHLGLPYSAYGASSPYIMVHRRSGSRVEGGAGSWSDGQEVFKYSYAQKVENIEKAVEELEAAGVEGIISDSGSLMSLMEFISHRASVPVILSPLAQIGLMSTALSSGKKVVVCTAYAHDNASVEEGSERWMTKDFIKRHSPPTHWDKVHVVSLSEAFKANVTTETTCQAIIRTLQNDSEENGYSIGALLMLNCEMPLYKPALQRAFRVPVRDITTASSFLELGFAKASYST